MSFSNKFGKNNKPELWTDKYRPKKIKDIIGNKPQIQTLCQWIEKFKAGDQNIKRCVLLSGNPGLGKTSSAICILENNGYRVVEFNASDIRTKSLVEESLYNLIQIKQLDHKKKPIAIIMDEVDGMTSGDKGGMSEIIKYINPNRGKGNRKKADQEETMSIPPLICICNNNLDRKLVDLRKDCLELIFEKPTKDELRELLKHVSKNENIKFDKDAEDLILEYAQGDFRRLITYMQNIDSLIIDNNVTLGIEEIEQCNYIFGEKSKDMKFEDSIKLALSSHNLSVKDILDIYNSHKNQFICSIYENYIDILSNNQNLNFNEKLNKMKIIMNDITWSDMIDRVIHKNQLWYLHKIHGILSCYLTTEELKTNETTINKCLSKAKFNQQKSNEKEINTLSSKLKSEIGAVSVHTLSQIVLHYLLDKPTPENITKGIDMLKSYNVDHTYIKALIKIDRLNEHPKYTTKLENMLKDKLPKTRLINVAALSTTSNTNALDNISNEIEDQEMDVDIDSNNSNG